MPCTSCMPPGASRKVMTSSKTSSTPHSAGDGAQALEEGAVGAQRAGAGDRLDDHRGQFVPVGADERGGAVEIVEGADDHFADGARRQPRRDDVEGRRDGHRDLVVRAVVAAGHLEDLRPGR